MIDIQCIYQADHMHMKSLSQQKSAKCIEIFMDLSKFTINVQRRFDADRQMHTGILITNKNNESCSISYHFQIFTLSSREPVTTYSVPSFSLLPQAQLQMLSSWACSCLCLREICRRQNAGIRL